MNVFMMKFLKKYKLRIFVEIVLSLFFFIMSLIPAFLIKILIDFIVNGDKNSIQTTLFLFLCLFYIVNSILNYFANEYFVLTRQYLLYDIRISLLDSISKIDYLQYQKIKIGELLYSITSDVANIGLYIDFLISLIVNILKIIALIVILSFISVKLILFYLLIVPIYILLVYYFKKKIILFNYQVKQMEAKMTEEFHDYFEKNIIYRVFSVIRIKLLKISEFLHSIIIFNKKAIMVERSASIVTGSITGLWSIILLWISSILILNKQITLGEMVLYFNLSNYLYTPIDALVNLFYSFQSMNVSYKRIANIMLLSTEDYSENKIEISDVCDVEFDDVSLIVDDKVILKDINFKTSSKKIFIIGSSGSGKTTLINMLIKLIKPTKGNIKVNGIPIEKIKDYTKFIGVCFDKEYIINDTVYNNIKFYRNISSGFLIDELINLLELNDFSDIFKQQDIESVISKNFSKGQRQRIALARALYSKPKILVLDEALSGVEYSMEKRILDKIDQYLPNSLKIISTHRINLINDDDIVIYLENGRLIYYGKFSEIKKVDMSISYKSRRGGGD
ncbi:ABC-type multidrug transport system, ATPase and permease component [Caloranaerobacter azorensis DSM 13643]|uniref:ABC-type multidrug transport system, ATPase and permease component n=1 Tax=Caloranaerobacter azorensis DSM 13643 TaxID=1121264 RepID=A0A1M5S1Z6_9FIRM|nr:ABC transporter ATP-binding protein [Caloranaerobacter azorensis]SHH32474.1 ABC-type multidrug transport system, ATPase and permease component [Caloranaerobacter azorensis DSM 13643]